MTPNIDSLTESQILSNKHGAICFTEDELKDNLNPFAKVDARALPRNGKGLTHRTGRCKCGKRCWPYAMCARCRGNQTIFRIMKTFEAYGDVDIVKDGRGRKGGRVWRASEKFKAAQATRKAAEKAQRKANALIPKIGRNDPCSCGSGQKHKRCCLNKV